MQDEPLSTRADESPDAVQTSPGWWRSWWRPTALAVVVVVLVVAGWARLSGWSTDDMQGPYGRFPQPLSAQPPVHQAQKVAVTSWPAVVYSGLVIMRDGQGVRAVNIATGKPYWRYRMSAAADNQKIMLMMDRTTGDVFAVGRRMALIDVAKGRVRWAHDVPDVGVAKDSADALIAGSKALVVTGERGIAAVDRATGRTLWTRRWPSDCPYDTIKPASGSSLASSYLAALDGIVVVACKGAERSGVAIGFDLAGGTPRWDETIAHAFSEHPAANAENWITDLWVAGDRLTLVQGAWTVSVDPATGRASAPHDWGAKPIGLSGTTLVGSCTLNKADAVCGSDATTGKALWRTAIPDASPNEDLMTGYQLTGDRVYVTAGALPYASGNRELVVLDAHTGGVLGQAPLGRSAYGFFEQPVTDGIITVLDVSPNDQSFADDLYADRPDLHTTRDLTR